VRGNRREGLREQEEGQEGTRGRVRKNRREGEREHEGG
jgi:hypothetical protein